MTGRLLAPVAFVLVLAACARSSSPACPPAPSSAPDVAPYGQTWVATRVNVSGIDEIDPLIANRFFQVPTAYVIESGERWPWMARASRTAYFTSVATFERFADDPTLRDVDAVLYDPEVWPATPAEEQRDPAAAMERFGALGHRLGFEVLITPGLTLPSAPGAVCAKHTGESDEDAYLRCGIARAAAEHADIVEVQSQTLEASAEDYRAFLSEAADQATGVNPDVEVLAGLRVRDDADLEEVKGTWAASVGIADGAYLSMRPEEAVKLFEWIAACAGGSS